MIRPYVRVAASALLCLALAGCSTEPPPVAPAPTSPRPQPMAIGGGSGSEHGNHEQVEAGPIMLDGVACELFIWDRPLNATTALRLRSASCPVPGRSWQKSVDIDRRLIPLADSPTLSPAATGHN